MECGPQMWNIRSVEHGSQMYLPLRHLAAIPLTTLGKLMHIILALPHLTVRTVGFSCQSSKLCLITRNWQSQIQDFPKGEAPFV